MDLIRRALAPVERRAATWGDSSIPSPGMAGGGQVAGVAVTETSALQVAAVYGSVGVIADSVSTLPLELFNSRDPVQRKKLAPSALIEQPYSEISQTDWLVQYCMSLALRGNFYGWIIERDQGGYASQIKPIHPDSVRVRRLYDGQIEYRFHNQVVPFDDVVHIRLYSVPESLVGLNPIEYLRNLFGSARATDLYGTAFYQNNGTPSGLIETEEDLDLDAVRELKANWDVGHQGLGNAHKVGVLTNGAKWQQVSLAPEDAQFLATKQYDAGAISGMIFRIPPHMIGIIDRSTSWGRGIEAQEMGYVRNTLQTYLGKLEDLFTSLHPGNQFVRFDVSQRLRGEKLTRYQSYVLARANGWMSANEIRGEEGMAPIPGDEGDAYLAPINSTNLEALANTAMQSGTQAEPVVPSGNGHGDASHIPAPLTGK